MKLLSNAFRGGSFFVSFCVNQGYLKAAYTATGTIETAHPLAHAWPSQAWATAGGGRGLGHLALESTGGRKVVERVKGGFLFLPQLP